jgi:hypothetical protein
MRTRSLLGKAALGALLLAAALAATPAAAHASTGSDEARFYSLTNQLRASVGAPGLTLDAGVSDVARAWSQQMAAAGDISHNPGREGQITGWSMLGENVGMGPSVDVIHQALVNSPHHYENLVNPDYVLVGIGVAYGAGNVVYVTEDFVTPSGRHSGPAPDPGPTDAPAPAPAPARVAASTPPPTEPAVTIPPEPTPPPAPAVTPAQLSFVFDQLRDWASGVFPGAESSVALAHDRSHPGNGG